MILPDLRGMFIELNKTCIINIGIGNEREIMQV